MKVLKILGLAAVAGLTSISASAQNAPQKTITNADLEKYTAARVKADEDYRQNYQQRGLSSPEELERRRVEKMKSLSEYSRQLRAERIRNEAAEELNKYNSANVQQYQTYQVYQQPFWGYQPGFLYGVPVFSSRSRLGSTKLFNNQNLGPNTITVREQSDRFNIFGAGRTTSILPVRPIAGRRR
jgi:hypothetical protein